MTLKDITNQHKNLKNTEKMPVLFLGHGSPMNAIEENEFVQGFRALARVINLSAKGMTRASGDSFVVPSRKLSGAIGPPRNDVTARIYPNFLGIM